MNSASRTRNFYRSALRERTVRVRAAKLGLVVGFIQVSLNQGDHWLRLEVTAGVILKSILSPFLSFAIACFSAVATHVETLQRTAAVSS